MLLFYFRERGEGRERERRRKREREREGERDQLVLLIYAFISCFLYVFRPGIEPTSLVQGDDALTN